MTLGESIEHVWRNYANTSGKASRSEYWWWQLYTFFLGVCVGLIESVVGIDSSILTILLTIVLLCPNFCLAIRRCHDSGHSGWWLMCPIANIVMMFLPNEE